MKTRSNTLKRPLVAVLLGSHAFGVKATYQYFAGYEPLSNVTHHSMIDLDLKDIIDGLGPNCGEDLNDCSATPACPGNACQYSADDMSFPTDEAQCAFTVANYAKINAPACSNSYDIWMDGKNSLKKTAVRSISKFASGAESKGSDAAIPYKDNAFIKVMNEYWESKGLDKYTWGFDMIKAAFDGTQIGELNFGTVGRTFRNEAIKKGLLYLNVYPYAIWEMQDKSTTAESTAPTRTRPSRRGTRLSPSGLGLRRATTLTEKQSTMITSSMLSEISAARTLERVRLASREPPW